MGAQRALLARHVAWELALNPLRWRGTALSAPGAAPWRIYLCRELLEVDARQGRGWCGRHAANILV